MYKDTRISNSFELKLEITECCQAKCSFCHQNFGANKSQRFMSSVDVFKWIEWAVLEGISCIRFTGGEPTLHPRLTDFCRAAKEYNLNITLNTNGLSRFSRIEKLIPYLGTVKLSLPTCDETLLDEITGVRKALSRKLETLHQTAQAGLKVDVLTVMIPENIGRATSFLNLLKDFPSVTWIPLRVESSPQCPRPVTRDQIQQLARELLWISTSPDYPSVRLGLATPFCAVDPIEIGAAMFNGRFENCGPFNSLSVDIHSHMMRCYSRRDPIIATNHDEKPSLNSLFQAALVEDALPQRCLDCLYLKRCQGGCRCDLALEERNGEFFDYLVPEEGVIK